MMETTKLIACPFCGRIPELTRIARFGHNYAIFHKCGNGLDVTVHKGKEKEVAEKWNCRVQA
jgi:hypothetical protein